MSIWGQSRNHYTGAHQVNGETIDRNAFIWDPSQSGSNTAYTANNLNQYDTITNGVVGGPAGCDGNQHQYSYDCKGNLIWSGGSAAQWTYTYDAENRLRTATSNDGSVAASYWYDPLGRRTYKLGTGVTQRFFLNDGDDEIVEYDGNKNVVELYVPGPAIDEPIAILTPDGSGGWTHEFFHTNHQGSVIMMTNDNGGIVEGPFTYSPFGSCSNSAGHACPTGVPYRFTGRRWDDETGLLYFRARYYFVALGRFLQTDPPGYAADMNLYTYVGNDPIGRTDPTGKNPSDYLPPGWYQGPFGIVYSDKEVAAVKQLQRNGAHASAQISVHSPTRLPIIGSQLSVGVGVDNAGVHLIGSVSAEGNLLESGMGKTSATADFSVGFGQLSHTGEKTTTAGILQATPEGLSAGFSTTFDENANPTDATVSFGAGEGTGATSTWNWEFPNSGGDVGNPGKNPSRQGQSDSIRSAQQPSQLRSGVCSPQRGGCGPGGGIDEIWGQ